MLGDNGGPTQTIKLLDGSPAIGAVTGTGDEAGLCGGFDQRGVARPATGCDAGAFEATPAVGGPVAPAVTSVSPSSGPVSGGTSVTITGSGFVAGDTVVIGQGYGPFSGAVPATDVVVVDSSHITAMTGGGAIAGTWNLFVVDAASNSSAGNSGDLFSYVPAVTAVSPSAGPVSGGTPVTITGSGFAAGDTVVIGQGYGPFNGALSATAVDVVDSSHITAVTPGGALVGTWNLFVVAGSGPSAGNSGDLFTYTAVPPAVTAVSPSSGPVSGGTSVTITGSGFVAGDTVVIGQGYGPFSGAVPATDVVVVDSSHITAMTGGGAIAGTWNLFVVDAASNSSAGNSGDLFSYVPAVTAVSPSAGPVSGGTPVTITGSGFAAGDTVVIGQGYGPFNGALSATAVDVVDSSHITAVTPGGALVGTWNLFVVAGSGPSAGNSGDLFTYN